MLFNIKHESKIKASQTEFNVVSSILYISFIFNFSVVSDMWFVMNPPPLSQAKLQQVFA